MNTHMAAEGGEESRNALAVRTDKGFESLTVRSKLAGSNPASCLLARSERKGNSTIVWMCHIRKMTIYREKEEHISNEI